MNLRLYVGNTNVVELEHLRNSVTRAHDPGATVEFTLQTEDGADLPGVTWPLNMGYDAADKVYRVVLPANVAIEEGEFYVGVVRAEGSGLEVGQWTVYLPAVVRGRV